MPNTIQGLGLSERSNAVRSGTAQDKAFGLGSQLADLFSRYIDESLLRGEPGEPPSMPTGSGRPFSNPTYDEDPRFAELSQALSRIFGFDLVGAGYNPQQFGETLNPPQYRGIRFLLPQSGGEYSILQEGRIPGYEAIQQAFLGEMIRRGYPVLGGTGQMEGFAAGFNPVGFGPK
mgnify:FL=1